MLKRLMVVSLMLFVGLASGYAQKGSIKGVVIDKSTNDQVPFASVVVKKLNGESLVLGTVSDDQGNFIVKDLPYGKYNVIVSFIGYDPGKIENVEVSKNSFKKNIGNVELATSNIAIDAVEVIAASQTASTKIDRKKYKVQDFETAKGGSAVDVLNMLPSVSVDPDGNVSVRGTTDFMVYLNGKPTLMEPSELLAQISGDVIDNIEVITVPSAKYDAQGKGGIINIDTKKTGAEGLSISANGLIGAAPWGELTDKYSNFDQNDDRYVGGLNLMYFKDKLSLYGGINYNKKNVNGMRTGDARVLVDKDNGTYKHMVASGERPEWYEFFSANAGIDYQLTDKSSLSASYFFGDRTAGRSAFYVYNVFYGDKNKNAIPGVDVNNQWIYNPNTDNRYGKFHTANIDFTQKFDNNSELKISALYEHSDLDRELHNLNHAYDRATDTTSDVEQHYKQTDDTPLDGYRLSIDYSKELVNGHAINFGFQPQYFNIAGGFGYDTLDVVNNQWGAYTSLENAVDLTRGVYAGYFDYSGNVGKLQFMAGLRLEYTDQKIDIESADYFSLFDGDKQSNYTVDQLDWFPTLHLNYKASDKDQVMLAASRRISRPPIKNMAPFLYRRHLEVFVVGDPELEPEYMNNLELSYDKKIGNHNVNLTGFYRGTENAIFRVNTITTENQEVLDVIKEDVLIRSYTNSGNTKALGVELNMNIDAGSFAKFFIGGSVYDFKVDSDIFGYKAKNSSTNWGLKGNMNLFLTKELKLTLDAKVNSATVTAQGQNDLFYMANTAVNYKPKYLSGWDFSVKVLDILRSNNTGLDTKAFNSDGDEIFYQETQYKRYGPIVEFTAAYSINMKGKSKKKGGSTFGTKEF